MTSPNPEQRNSTQGDRIMVAILGGLVIAFLGALLILGHSVERITLFTAFAMAFLPLIASQLTVHSALKRQDVELEKQNETLARVERQTNGMLTERLQTQTEEIIEGIAAATVADAPTDADNQDLSDEPYLGGGERP